MKIATLKLFKDKTQNFMYNAYPILGANGKTETMDGFLDENSIFFFTEYENLPTILTRDKNTLEITRMIDFYKRINHQLFGQNHETGKCVFGMFSNAWHKKTNVAELTLFESEVLFDDLYHFDFHDGIYVPELSTKQNWIQTYHAAHPDNLMKSHDYAMSQSKPSELLMILDLMRKDGLNVD
ncbi:MAG: hypothetical protein JWQ09_3092 [Segetibacter sp.]|nr:hypothetical protein [Segetibacter sp.]